MIFSKGARRGRIFLASAAFAVLGGSGSAGAATAPSFSCTANAVWASVSGASPINPVTAGADGQPCQPAVSGLPNTTEALKLDALATARSAYAAVDVKGAPAYRSKPVSAAGVENLTVKLGGAPLVVGAANSAITGSCVNGAAKYATTSEVAGLSLAGTPLLLDGVLQPVTDALNQAVGALVEVKLNELVDLKGGGKAVRAVHVTLIRGGKPVADAIVAESRLGLNGSACNPNATGDPPTTPPSICPQGSVYDPTRNVCVIAVPGSQTPTDPVGTITGPGTVIVGPPHTGPYGGTVITLVQARKRFPRSPCVRGAGPKYVVVGTRKPDMIRGSNRADRIITLGGQDVVHARKGKDCVGGGRGGDEILGQQANDRLYGGRGSDVINGGGGRDLMMGGASTDRINASHGPDRVYGGKGNDVINTDLANLVAAVWGGKGRDRVRCNVRALRRIHQTEVIHVVQRYRRSA